MKLICVLFLSIFSLCMCNIPEVKTPYGTYRGEIIKSRGGRDIFAYRGIPYAQPPVGKLRLKEPVKLENGKGAQSSGEKICIQPAMSLVMSEDKPKVIGEEDCLYLNVFVPKVEHTEPLPVYVWIHGGAYFVGSGIDVWSSPDALLDKNRNMIMVSINYRLGPLGFLSADDEIVPGNFGMKDQTMAIKWVKENIEAFGGNPDSITIGGVSAGGASTSLHLHSKSSKGLFHRVISQSGTADCNWAIQSTTKAREMSNKLLSALGCSADPNTLLDCLQKVPADEFVDSLHTIKIPEVPFYVSFAPVIEKDSPNAFMTKESFEEGSSVPWISGLTNEESLIINQFLVSAEPGFKDLSILKSDGEWLLPLINYYDGHPDEKSITRKIIKYYFKNGFNEGSVKSFLQMLSDFMFNHGLHLSGAKYKGKLYKYLLSYRGKHSLTFMRPEGTEHLVGHGDDIFYLSPEKPIRYVSGNSTTPATPEDENITNIMCDMWYNFIKTGDPTPESHIWKESEGGRKYLDITNDGLIMSADMFQDRMKFLDTLNTRSILHEEL